MSLHPPESLHAPGKWGAKLCYASLFLVLGAVAIVCVIKQSKETAIASAGLRGALTNIDKSTKEITRVTSLNTKLQEKLLGQDSRISELAQESFRTITGANSFPYLSPQPADYPNAVPLVIWDNGKYMLTGVTVSIRHAGDYSFYQAPIDIGVLHPGWGKQLSVMLVPRPDPKTGEDIFWADFYTQSSFYTEVIHVRRGHDGKSWAYQFWVTEHQFKEEHDASVRPKPKVTPRFLKHTIGWSYVVYDRSRWSDEPAKSGPVKQP